MINPQRLEELFDTMWQLRKLLVSQTQETHEEQTATAMQFAALMFIRQHKRATVGDVANHLQLSKSSATQLVDRLVHGRLVTRSEDATDRRIVRLDLTDDGSRRLKNIRQQYLAKMGALLSKVPESDLVQLIRIHTNLIQTLQEE
jgi:DNA-binding MarR family transcriptional regulator